MTHYAAAFWMILNSISFAIFSILHKYVEHKIMPFQLFFLVTSIGTLVMLPFFIKHGVKKLSRENIRLYFGRAIIISVAMSTWFMVLGLMETIEAVAISYTLPLMNAILGIILLREKLKSHRIISISVSFIGMFLILQPAFKLDISATLLALVVPLLWSLSDILLKVQSRTEDAITQTFYLLLFTSICTMPQGLGEWQDFGVTEFYWLLIIAAFFIISAFAAFKAYKMGDIGYVASFDYVRIIFTVSYCSLVFGEEVTPAVIYGSSLIFLSSIYNTYMERKKHLAANLAN